MNYKTDGQIMGTRKVESLLSIAALTSLSFDLYRLAGKANEDHRQMIMTYWTGTNQAKAKCGIRSIRQAMIAYFSPHGDCQSAIDDDLADLMRTALHNNS